MEETQRTRRIVLHIDLDAYYASIEQRDHPELRGKPVVVGGSREGRGVVATCSYEARTLSLKVRWSDFQLITHSTSRTQGFQSVREMLPVLHTLLSQLGSEKRAIRLLGVFVSNLRPARAEQIESITSPSLWDDH
jgi:nucleotidyltransferase/DNA polymerase involved in DNA repair